MSIDAAVEIAQVVAQNADRVAGGDAGMGTAREENEPERGQGQGPGQAKPPPRVEIYRLGEAGHSFLVDNPLAMVDAIMRSMDVQRVRACVAINAGMIRMSQVALVVVVHAAVLQLIWSGMYSHMH